MNLRTLRVTLNGTGFAADYTAACYGLIPHKNGVAIELAGVTSGRMERAQAFAQARGVTQAYDSHTAMLAAVRPDIDNICCANDAHGPYVCEAAEIGTPVIVLEKPPVVWPGFAEQRTAPARVRTQETMAYFAGVLDAVRRGGSRLLYAEDFVYFDGIKGLTELLREALKVGKGKIVCQRGICAHQGSHAVAYDTPTLSGGGALFNKACHPLGPCLYLKQAEGILRDGRPIRPLRVAALATQVLKHQAASAGEHFRVMKNVDDFGRLSVLFEDQTIAEVVGHDLSISGIRNEVSVIADFGQYDLRVNPSNEHELFLPDARAAGTLLFREKLPTVSPQPHTHLAFEGFQYAREHGKGNEYNHRILEAFFQEGQEIGSIDVLAKLAEEVGLDESEFRSVLETRKYREAHQQALRQAQETGIRAVPTFVIGGRVLTGLQRKENLERVIAAEQAGDR